MSEMPRYARRSLTDGIEVGIKQAKAFTKEFVHQNMNVFKFTTFQVGFGWADNTNSSIQIMVAQNP